LRKVVYVGVVKRTPRPSWGKGRKEIVVGDDEKGERGKKPSAGGRRCRERTTTTQRIRW